MPIMSTLALGLKNAYFGVSKCQKVSPDHKKLFGLTIEGPHVVFYKKSTSSTYPGIAYFGHLGLKLTLLAKSTYKPPIHDHCNFYGQNQETMLNFIKIGG